jgi:hypothetical protein
MILLLNVVMEEGNGVWGQGDADIEDLPDPLKGKRIVDGKMTPRRRPQGGMICEMGATGPHAANL